MQQIDIKFNNNIPTWELFKNLGVQQAFPKIIVIMEVFSVNEMIYSVQYKIEGHYYCCGSQNFEFEENTSYSKHIQNTELLTKKIRFFEEIGSFFFVDCGDIYNDPNEEDELPLLGLQAANGTQCLISADGVIGVGTTLTAEDKFDVIRQFCDDVLSSEEIEDKVIFKYLLSKCC